MITGGHVILFTADADAARSFIRDALGFRGVDAGDGWLIFALPPAELAVHPGDEPRHELYLTCDDLDATMADLAAKGAAFDDPVEASWGRIATMTIPGGARLGVYEPRHPRP